MSISAITVIQNRTIYTNAQKAEVLFYATVPVLQTSDNSKRLVLQPNVYF